MDVGFIIPKKGSGIDGGKTCCAIGMTGKYSHPIIHTPMQYQSCMGDWLKNSNYFAESEQLGSQGTCSILMHRIKGQKGKGFTSWQQWKI